MRAEDTLRGYRLLEDFRVVAAEPTPSNGSSPRPTLTTQPPAAPRPRPGNAPAAPRSRRTTAVSRRRWPR